LGDRVGGAPRMLTEVPSEGATISAFTLAGGRIDKFIFMHFNNNIGDRLDR